MEKFLGKAIYETQNNEKNVEFIQDISKTNGAIMILLLIVAGLMLAGYYKMFYL